VNNNHSASLVDDLALALELADVADAITRAHFQPGGLSFENKSDGSPVTAIDRAVEQVIRERVAVARPDHVVLGEEAGGGASDDRAGGRSRWIVDPIDGTRKFVRGIGIFATLIALEVDGELVVGVASAPFMGAAGRRWWAAHGLGAFSDGRPIHVSGIERLEDAHVLHGSVEGWVRRGYATSLTDLSTACWGTTGYGDFWIHLLVAEGAAEAALEPDSAVWDVAALKVIVEEAGGSFTDFEGRRRADGGSGLSSNGLVHDAVLGVLAGRS
jgi:histidinol-phosphatase